MNVVLYMNRQDVYSTLYKVKNFHQTTTFKSYYFNFEVNYFFFKLSVRKPTTTSINHTKKSKNEY
ncbi:hypothetical protein Fleli_0569 [Bernardetia litoralis DSM 6794]|uniref:Uncharacterized protein n=1 Tax=Bernardetia litoralis (strain ATCC 23117 / DSM 6794 / NBRC 15988 / NCIMB 1366 / Fx l1 / Sio-4) TaxID=880071 RepID=I4AGF0_BERLS|nr:hypothetical protein Fleli_0569 [Bernardetia litoralis DSM 6794]